MTWSYGYLYVILDIFSRYVVGWMVALAESAVLAQRLITDTCEKQQIGTGQLTLHADRGPSMTSNPVAWLLADLGVTNTHRRPYTSDDNPFSEAQFKTLTYRPDFPARFGSLDDARVFCQTFFSWDNGEHRHAGIGLMTPAVVHDGRANTMRDARQQVLMTAYAAHPERFVRKPPQPPILPHAVWIHPPKEPSASQDGTEATISIADDQRVALNVEGLGVVSETVIVSPDAITTPTDEVLTLNANGKCPKLIDTFRVWWIGKRHYPQSCIAMIRQESSLDATLMLCAWLDDTEPGQLAFKS